MAFAFGTDTESPSWQIVEYLQRHTSATIKELEEMLGVTSTAVRQHLAGLQAAGYVARRTVNAGVGRPYHIYAATEDSRKLFDCHCDDLALTMLEEMFEMVGPDNISHLLRRVSGRLADRYGKAVKSPVLLSRVQEMAGVLGHLGVLTDVLPQDSHTIILKTYNCPYHELAQEHRQICDMDQEMMQQVLGHDVALNACIMDGDGGCSFTVTKDRTVYS
ncbi:MAG: MarR family transcriptional regulator [Caldilineaceae bacterium]|nr:MarR family transcriptional regulator [Caldilineaceae bacterium]HRJ43418.1 MarR family transcriptional regulator [Caldilineaceae bacterium]